MYQNVAEPLPTEDMLAHELQAAALKRATCVCCLSRRCYTRCGVVRQVDAQMTLPSEWQLEHPVSRAVVGAHGTMRKDVCWLPPGSVMDLYAQF